MQPNDPLSKRIQDFDTGDSVRFVYVPVLSAWRISPAPREETFLLARRVEIADGGMCVEDWSYGSYFNGGIEWIREYLRWMGNISRSSQV
jgi:hypothetical protein